MIELPHTKIRNFSYSGFCGRILLGKSKYSVTSFVKWTRDPGIGVFRCSDGKERLVPTFAFIGSKRWKKIKQLIPEQDLFNKVYFGSPCQS